MAKKFTWVDPTNGKANHIEVLYTDGGGDPDTQYGGNVNMGVQELAVANEGTDLPEGRKFASRGVNTDTDPDTPGPLSNLYTVPTTGGGDIHLLTETYDNPIASPWEIFTNPDPADHTRERTGGNLVITLSETNSHTIGEQTETADYVMTPAGIYIDASMPAGSQSVEGHMMLWAPSYDHQVLWLTYGGNLLARSRVDGTNTNRYGPVTYSETTHRFLRIGLGDTADEVVWYTSSDGITWTERARATVTGTTFNLNTIRPLIRGSTAAVTVTVSRHMTVAGLNVGGTV